MASSFWTRDPLGAVWIMGHQDVLLLGWCEHRILRGDAWLESDKKEVLGPCLMRGQILEWLVLILSVDYLL